MAISPAVLPVDVLFGPCMTGAADEAESKQSYTFRGSKTAIIEISFRLSLEEWLMDGHAV